MDEPISEPERSIGGQMKEENFRAVEAQLRAPPARVENKTRLLLISLSMFAAVSVLQGGSIVSLLLIVAVLFVHELGHAAGMLALGYTDVRVFFIPFLGAATAGQRRNVARWKHGIVLMLGPLPGLVAGTVLLWNGADGFWHTLGLQLVAINAFNLLPIAPFDGGQLFQLILFSRHRHVEVGFLAVAAALMIGLAVLLKSWVLGVIGVFMLLALPSRKKVLAAASELRDLPADPKELDEAQRRQLFDAVWTMMPVAREKPVAQAATMMQIHERATQGQLTLGTSLGVGALWIAGVVITGAAIVAIALGPIAHWQRYHPESGRFSIELPAKPTESSDKFFKLHAQRGRTHGYDVLWGWHVSDAATWVAERKRAIGVKGTMLRELSIPDSDAAYVVKMTTDVTMVRMVVSGASGYIIMATAREGEDPDGERVLRSFQVDAGPGRDPWKSP